MTLKELQSRVDGWIKEKGVRYFNELTNTTILMEEVGEFARIMAREYGEQSYKDSDLKYDKADELADIIFVLVCLANQMDLDLETAIVKNLDKKSNRDADRHQNNPKLK
ncbi:MAG: pyrophosphatase [Marinilabiliales bacterium]|nr:MAG: pyrophosphatase [Marinilabiliales bacterium]